MFKEKNMNQDNINLLVATYQNISTAVQSIENCYEDIMADDFKKELDEEISYYKKLSADCEELSRKYNIDLKDNNVFEKARLWSSIKINTIIDKSERHYAELFFIGSNMGVFNMICAICDNKKSDKQITELAQKVLQAEENYAIDIKKYFCRK